MKKKHIIFVPGKSPKPLANQHKKLLWKTLLEGVQRAEPETANDIEKYKSMFHVISWNFTYYQHSNDYTQYLPWIDELLNKSGPTKQDIREAHSWKVNLTNFLYTVADHLPWLVRLLPEVAKETIEETTAYFDNHGNVGYEIRGMLKKIIRPILDKNESVLIIGHSLGSIIGYDALWELSHNEVHSGKVDFLTLGSPLGLKFVQNKLQGRRYPNKNKFPTNIKHWINLSSVGDTTAVDRRFENDFSDMIKFDLIDSIEDHCDDIYNFYHDDNGLDCHGSYGYLVNPSVGKIIAKWWRGNIVENGKKV